MSTLIIYDEKTEAEAIAKHNKLNSNYRIISLKAIPRTANCYNPETCLPETVVKAGYTRFICEASLV